MAYWLLNNDFFANNQRPYSRINDQHFGLVLQPEDMLVPLMLSSRGGGYQRPWRLHGYSDAGSTVAMGTDQFKVNLDVQQFKPEEISVKVTGDGTAITIEGKHEEKRDEHGYVSRQFVRRYVLPKGHDATKVESKLSSDGVLTVTAPRMALAGETSRTVAITQTGEAFRSTATEKKHAGVEMRADEKKADANQAAEKKLKPEVEKAIEKKVEMGIEMLIERQAEKYVEDMVMKKKMNVENKDKKEVKPEEKQEAKREDDGEDTECYEAKEDNVEKKEEKKKVQKEEDKQDEKKEDKKGGNKK